MLKGKIPDLSSLSALLKSAVAPWDQIKSNPHIFIMILTAAFFLVVLYRKKRSFWSGSTLINLIFLTAMTAHVQFAKIGWFYRYEAYLMALGFFAFFISLKEFLPADLKRLVSREMLKGRRQRFMEITVLTLIVLAVLSIRGWTSLIKIPKAGKNIYEQQCQTAFFLRTYYQKKEIAANDIGAINFFADIKCLDLWGLADMDVARAKRAKQFDTSFIKELTESKNIQIAVLYDYWFEEYGGLPPEWKKVGEWEITDNVVCGSPVVAFYAVDPGEKDFLLNNLRSFSSRLPDGIKERFYY
jgi:hypothetical protein